MTYQHCGLAVPWPRMFSPQVIIRDSRGCGNSVSENAVFPHHHEMPDDCNNVSPGLLDLSPSAGYKYCGSPQTSCRTSTSREEGASYGAHDLSVRKHHEDRVCGTRYRSPPDMQPSTPQQHQRRDVSSGLQLARDHGAPWCHRPVSGTHSDWPAFDNSVLQYKASCLGTRASRLDIQSGRSHLGDLQGLDLSRCSPDTGPVGTGDITSVTKSNTELPHNMCACNTTNADTNPSVILRRGFSDQNVHTDVIQHPCSSNGNFQTGSYDHYHVSKETQCLKVAHALTAKQLSECDSDTAILQTQCCGVDDSNDGDEVCAKHGRCHAHSSKIHGVSHTEQRCQRIPVTGERRCQRIPITGERRCPLPSRPAEGLVCFTRSTDTRDVSATHHSRPAEGLVCFTRSTDTRDVSATHHTVSEVQNSQPHVVHQKNTSQTDSPLADINPFCVKYHGVWTVTKLRSTEPESPVSVGSGFRLYDADQNLTPVVDFAGGHSHISVCGCSTCQSNTYPRNAHEGSQWNKNGSPHVPQDRTLLKYSQTTYQQGESDNDEPYDLSMKNSGSRKERRNLEKNVSVSVPEVQPTGKACLVSEGRGDFGNEAGSEPAARLALTLPSIPVLSLRSSQAPDNVSDLHQGFVESDMETTDMPLTEQVPELWLTEGSGSGPEPCRSCDQKRKDQCSLGMVGRHEQHEQQQAWNYGTSQRRTTFCFQWESGIDSPTESRQHDPIPNLPTPLRVKFEHERSEDVQMALAESPDPVITPESEPDSQHHTLSTAAAMRTGPESAVVTSVSPDAERSGSYPTFSAPVSIAPRTKIHQNSLLLLQSVVTLSQQSHHKHVAAKEGVGHEVHVRTSTGKRRRTRPRRFRCHLCAVTCCNRGQLRGHLRTHTGERPYLCQEPGCHKTFVRNEELTRHRRIHSGERPYECGLCGKTFMRKDHLNKHVRMHGAARGGGVEHADTRG